MRAWLVIALTGIGAAQSPGPSYMAREMVAAHNAVRARAGVPALAWSNRLAARAQEWADWLLARNRFEHSRNPEFGENLFEIMGAPASPAGVVGDWAAESGDYDYRSNTCRGVCGHYTQIVWRDTNEVGCGVARGRGREVWACEYSPPGNYVGERPW